MVQWLVPASSQPRLIIIGIIMIPGVGPEITQETRSPNQKLNKNTSPWSPKLGDFRQEDFSHSPSPVPGQTKAINTGAEKEKQMLAQTR